MDDINEKIDLDNFAKLSRYRNIVYNFFSRVFARKTDREFLESIASDEIIDIISGVCENEGSSKELNKAIRNMLFNSDKFFEVESEFERHFIIPVNDRFIPPYISYYLGDKSKRINLNGGGKSVSEAEGDITLVDRLELTYKSLNFTLKETNGVSLKRPDHVSYILGFMGALVNLEEKYQAGQAKNPLTFQEVISNEFSFFNEFIESWINLFAEEVIEKADLPFYAETARLMQSFVCSEQRDFKSVLLQN
ncbi:MAG: TorD/DmsD family molecular chaperone [bacterium]